MFACTRTSTSSANIMIFILPGVVRSPGNVASCTLLATPRNPQDSSLRRRPVLTLHDARNWHTSGKIQARYLIAFDGSPWRRNVLQPGFRLSEFSSALLRIYQVLAYPSSSPILISYVGMRLRKSSSVAGLVNFCAILGAASALRWSPPALRRAQVYQVYLGNIFPETTLSQLANACLHTSLNQATTPRATGGLCRHLSHRDSAGDSLGVH
jgi:hypothetical protein